MKLLGPSGPIVSPVWDAPRWERRTIPFPPGTHLLVYTDGVSEAQGPDGFFGAERVQEIVERAREGGSALLDAVTEGVAEFVQGRRYEDDVTLMAVTNHGNGPARFS